jgi:hypothetical protein
MLRRHERPRLSAAPPPPPPPVTHRLLSNPAEFTARDLHPRGALVLVDPIGTGCEVVGGALFVIGSALFLASGNEKGSGLLSAASLCWLAGGWMYQVGLTLKFVIELVSVKYSAT